MLVNVDSITNTGGMLSILIIALIVFAESGLLIGFFLPGDTLLFGAGLAASQGRMSIVWLVFAVTVAAIIGDNVGYSIGRRTGRRAYHKKDSILFKKEHIERAQAFYDKHGGKTIILARFTPIVRTFAPMVAGIGKMPRQRFLLFNVAGGILWGAGMPLLGYWLGNRIPGLEHYIEAVLIGVIILSIAISLGHLFRDPDNRRLMRAKIKHSISTLLLNKKVH